MNYKPVKAVTLRNNDKFIDVDGIITVTNIKLNFLEDIVEFTGHNLTTGYAAKRWIAMDRLVNKVTS
jgi:hypothetical protein|nr:MAG TPA: hypothetical protein [Caudoviricetes sp.]